MGNIVFFRLSRDNKVSSQESDLRGEVMRQTFTWLEFAAIAALLLLPILLFPGTALALTCGASPLASLPMTCVPQTLGNIPGGTSYGYDVSKCGASPASADNWPVIQSVIYKACVEAQNLQANGKSDAQVAVYIPAAASPSSAYTIRQALQVQSYVTISADNNANILCSGVGMAWPLSGCALFGSYETTFFSRLTPYAALPIKQGDATVAFASDAPTLEVGDLILIETTSGYSVGGNNRPTWGQMNRVAGVADNAIKLTYPVDTNQASVQLIKLTNTGLTLPGTNPSIPLWATYKASLYGGNWKAQAPTGQERPFSAVDGALACNIFPNSTFGGWGVGYFNLAAHCQAGAREVSASITPIEMGYLSHDNSVVIGHLVVPDLPQGLPYNRGYYSWLIGIGESSRNNKIYVADLNVTQHTTETSWPSCNAVSPPNCPLFDIVAILAGSSNQVTIGTLAAPNMNLRYSVVDIDPLAYPGAIPDTKDNIIQIGSSKVAGQRQYVSISGTAATPSSPGTIPTRNFVEGNSQHGFVTFQGQLYPGGNSQVVPAFLFSRASDNRLYWVSVSGSQSMGISCLQTTGTIFWGTSINGAGVSKSGLSSASGCY